MLGLFFDVLPFDSHLQPSLMRLLRMLVTLYGSILSVALIMNVYIGLVLAGKRRAIELLLDLLHPLLDGAFFLLVVS